MMRSNRLGRWASVMALLALLVAPAAWADLAGQAGPYSVRAQMQPETPAVGDNQARIRVTDPSGQPARGAKVSVTTEMLDMPMGSQITQGKDDGTGTYVAPVSLSMGGNWRLKVAVSGAAGKGEAAFKVTTGVSTAGDAAAGSLPWKWIGGAALALALAVLALLRRRGGRRTTAGASDAPPWRVRRAPGAPPATPSPVRRAWVSSLWSLVSGHAWGIAAIVLALVVSGMLVKKYKKPGQMTVLEAQSMDMSSTKAPVGTVPVKTETVQPGSFESAVTYSGSVLSEADEEIYPRVVGKLDWMPFYPGDKIAPGQVVARLDNVELSAKADEARADRTMKQYESAMARAGISQAESQRTEAEARALKARGGVRDAESSVIAAQGALRQARSELDAMRSDLRDAQSQQVSAERDRDQSQEGQEGARAGLADAEAGVTSAEANLTYWRDEMKREAALLKSGAISPEEYDRENSQYVAAQAAVRQARERVRSMQSALRASGSKIQQSAANISAAQARADKAQANIAAAQARIDQAQAALQSAQARVSQAEAEVREADAAVRTAGETVRVAQEGAARGTAAEQGAAAGQRTAETIRGYTEIRSSGGGRVVQRLVSPGVLVSPGTPILRIAQVARVRLQASVAQADLGSIHIGSQVRVTSQKNPARVISTRITAVFPASDPSSRTALVEALTPNPGHFLLPGEFITLKISTGGAGQALAISSQAIADFEGRPAVWKVVDGKAQRVLVTTGKADGDRTQVLSGLNPGDTVITIGNTYLNPGDAVVPTQWGADGPADSALQHQVRPMTGDGGQGTGNAPARPPASSPPSSAPSMPGMGD